MIKNRIRLSDALRMAAGAVSDSNIREGCRLLAQDVEQGRTLSESVITRPHFPRTLANAFRWQDHGKSLADALYAWAEIYSAMAKTQTGLIQVVWEPMLIILVGCFLAFCCSALFWPLIQLIDALS